MDENAMRNLTHLMVAGLVYPAFSDEADAEVRQRQRQERGRKRRERVARVLRALAMRLDAGDVGWAGERRPAAAEQGA